jgi:hypothetical protein
LNRDKAFVQRRVEEGGDAIAAPRKSQLGSTWVVALHRKGWNKLDTDGLVTANKHVRDAVADWLGEDDRSTRIRWVLSQEITRERRTVEQLLGGRLVGLRTEAAATVRVEVATDEDQS